MQSLEEFGAYLKNERRYSRHTQTAYITDIGQFFSFIHQQYGKMAEADIKASFVKAWIYERIQGGLSGRSMNRKLTALNTYYKYLLRTGKLSINPLSAISSVKTKKRLHNWVTEDDMMRLLDNVDFGDGFPGTRNKLIIEMLYGCGIRLSELISLRHEGVDLRGGTVRVLGKRNKERIIPVPRELKRSIEEYLEAKKNEGLPLTGIFLTTDKGDSLYPMFVYRIVRHNLGIVSTQTKLSPHVLRHTYATHLLNKGAEIGAIKELLGHSSLAATQVYTHNSIERLKDIYKQAHPKGKKS